MRLIYKLVLLNILAACGPPSSDAVLTKGTPKVAATDSPGVEPVRVPAPRIVAKQYRGWYMAVGDTSLFQPCDARVPLDVDGPPVVRFMLKDRYRFSAPWPRAKLFSVVHGAIVTDTSRASGATGDSGKIVSRTRFLITGVDSMRASRSSDCGGRRP